MRLWIVIDADYEDTWIVAVYPTEDLANKHVLLMGGLVTEQEIRDSLHPDAVDPVKQREREEKAEKARQLLARKVQYREECDRAAEALLPTPPHMNLCHCRAFSDHPPLTAHGYCRYCGGWAPSVFRAHMGEAALHQKIDELAIHTRSKMRAMVAATA